MDRRLPFTTFDFPVQEFRRGYYAAVYFWREKRILENSGLANKRGLMQIFNKVDNSVICGIDEALALLRVATGTWSDYDAMYPLFDRYVELKEQLRARQAKLDFEGVMQKTQQLINIQKQLDELWVDMHSELEINALRDGDRSPAFDAAMTIDGPAASFAHLESTYLGILARSTRIATNTREVVEATNGKPVLFFADRFDRYGNHSADGYAAMIGGAKGVASDAMGKWWGVEGSGTTPHALIAMHDGDTAAATLNFIRQYPDIYSIALVDFHNDCVDTSIEVARKCADAGVKLNAVRLDTSGSMIDKSVVLQMAQFKPTGVCIPLTENVRTGLDNAGFPDVDIYVSGGFNQNKIRMFEAAGAPVTGYGVGSSLLSGNFDFTADIVEVEGQPMAKVGRTYRPGEGLNTFNWSEIEPK